MPQNAVAKKTAALAEADAGKGLLVTESWEREGLFPENETQLLRIGEEQNKLKDVLDELMTESEAPTNVFHYIIKPSFYPHMFALFVGISVSISSKAILEQFAGNYPDILDSQFSYHLSLFLRTYLGIIAAIVVCLCVSYVFACRQITGGLRQKLKFLFADSDRQLASRFLYLNELLSRQGATPGRIVQTCLVLMKGRHAQKSLKIVMGRLSAGEDFLIAARSRLLPPWASDMARGLSPGNNPATLPAAYDAVRITMDARAVQTYQLLSNIFNGVMLFAGLGAIGLTILGMYDTVNIMTDRMQTDF